MYVGHSLYSDENSLPSTPDFPNGVVNYATLTLAKTPPSSPRKFVAVRATQFHTYSTFKQQVDVILQKTSNDAVRAQLQCLVDHLDPHARAVGSFYTSLLNRIELALACKTRGEQLAELGLLYFYINKEGRMPHADSLIAYRLHEIDELVDQKEMAIEQQRGADGRLIDLFITSLFAEMAVCKDGKLNIGGLLTIIESLDRCKCVLLLKSEHVELIQNVCRRLLVSENNLSVKAVSETGKMLIALELRMKKEEVGLDHVLKAILCALFAEVRQVGEENCYAVATYSWAVQTYPEKMLEFFALQLQLQDYQLKQGLAVPAFEVFKHRFLQLVEIKDSKPLFAAFFEQGEEPESKKIKRETVLSEEMRMRCVSLYHSSLQSYLLSLIQLLETNDEDFLQLWVEAYISLAQSSLKMRVTRSVFAQALIDETRKSLFLENLHETAATLNITYGNTSLKVDPLTLSPRTLKQNLKTRNGLVYLDQRKWEYITSFERFKEITAIFIRNIERLFSAKELNALLTMHASETHDALLAKHLHEWNEHVYSSIQEEHYSKWKLLLIAQQGGRPYQSLNWMKIFSQDYQEVKWRILDAKQFTLKCFETFAAHQLDQWDFPVLIMDKDHIYHLLPNRSHLFYSRNADFKERLDRYVIKPGVAMRDREMDRSNMDLIIKTADLDDGETLCKFHKVRNDQETLDTFIRKMMGLLNDDDEEEQFFSALHKILYSMTLPHLDFQKFEEQLFASPHHRWEKIQMALAEQLEKEEGLEARYSIPHFARLMQKAIFSSGFGYFPISSIEEQLYRQLNLPMAIALGDLNYDESVHNALFGVAFSFETDQLEYCHLEDYAWKFDPDGENSPEGNCKLFVPKVDLQGIASLLD